MRTLDLRAHLKHLYAARASRVDLVDVPALRYLMVDGTIEPGTAPADSTAFQEGVGALYAAAYTSRFAAKLRKVDPVDYPVMPLEGLWWSEGGPFHPQTPTGLHWTLMILQPDEVTAEQVEEAKEQARARRDVPGLDGVRLDVLCEGLCIQTLHVGPYADEPATMARMRAFADERGIAYRGAHHEVYLGDPRRAKPERLRTILRQPVAG